MYYRSVLNIPHSWNSEEKIEIIMSEIRSNLTSKISCAEIYNDSGLVIYFEGENMSQIQFLGIITRLLNNLLIKGYIYE